MVAHLALLGVERRDQQRFARIRHGDALALDNDLAVTNNLQQDVSSLRVQQIDVVDVQHAPVGPRQQPGLEDGLALLDRFFHINATQKHVVHDA